MSVFGSGYNRHAARMISGEVMRDFGQATVDQLIRDYDLVERWDMRVGEYYDTLFKEKTILN
jgi:hypothetical protein